MQEDKTPITVKDLSGHDEGEEVVGPNGQPTGEVVVADRDEAGNVIGWHKEAKA